MKYLPNRLVADQFNLTEYGEVCRECNVLVSEDSYSVASYDAMLKHLRVAHETEVISVP